MRAPLSFAVLFLLISPSASASDWPHWRGPDRNGMSSEIGLPVQWGPDENIVWKLAMPAVSGSTPIIVADKIFLNIGDGDDVELWALNRANGEVLWRRDLSSGNKVTRKQNMSSPSPVTDGERVWVLTGTGALKGFDFDGTEIWSRDLQADYGPFGLNWGYASSPLLHDDTLYVQVLHGMRTDDPSYVLAIDPATGKNRWHVERPTDAIMESPDSYTTPAMLELGGREELIITGGDYITGHDPATGKELWRVAGLNPDKRPNYRIVASPVVVAEMIYVPSRVSPLLALDASQPGTPEIAWSLERATDVPTPAVDGDVFYLVTDRGLISRLDAKTGKAEWESQRLAAGTYSASPVVADGKLYITNEEGVTTVVKAGPEFEILATNELEGYTLSSIAIADGRLFLRTKDFLYCIGSD